MICSACGTWHWIPIIITIIRKNIYNLLYLSIRVTSFFICFFFSHTAGFFDILFMLAFTEQRHIWNVNGREEENRHKEEKKERTCVAFITLKQRHHKISLHLVSVQSVYFCNYAMHYSLCRHTLQKHSGKMQTEQIKKWIKTCTHTHSLAHTNTSTKFINFELISFYLFCKVLP